MIQSKQDAYDAIVEYFSQPGSQFGMAADKKVCRYRTEAGQKCAVGCLIPDELYDPEWEGSRVWMVYYRMRAAVVFGDVHDMGAFLEECQDCHDSAAMECRTMDDFLRDLKGVAEEHGLTVAGGLDRV